MLFADLPEQILVGGMAMALAFVAALPRQQPWRPRQACRIPGPESLRTKRRVKRLDKLCSSTEASGTFDSSLFFWGEGRLWGVEALFDTVFLALISLTTVFFAHGVKPASVCCPFFDLSIEPCGPAVVLAFFLEFLVCDSMCFILHRCR